MVCLCDGWVPWKDKGNPLQCHVVLNAEEALLERILQEEKWNVHEPQIHPPTERQAEQGSDGLDVSQTTLWNRKALKTYRVGGGLMLCL